MANRHAPIVFNVGDDYPIETCFQYPDGTPLNPIAVMWRLVDPSGNVKLTYSLGQGITLLDTEGHALIDLASADTGTLAPGYYFDQCRVVDQAGKPSTQFEGAVIVEESFFTVPTPEFVFLIACLSIRAGGYCAAP